MMIPVFRGETNQRMKMFESWLSCNDDSGVSGGNKSKNENVQELAKL
ncbi:hypothetical protein Xinn_03918 [Xenorhabdus innexi]|uniref:Uncharacterized protein n=1 Tax=Xenorhabdus innexi TaxID=290109 RepID=A0A2G0MZH0_9GAMM|nr:hypothetical protein Xinn_03918 [Xenorhabdus innexi]